LKNALLKLQEKTKDLLVSNDLYDFMTRSHPIIMKRIYELTSMGDNGGTLRPPPPETHPDQGVY